MKYSVPVMAVAMLFGGQAANAQNYSYGASPFPTSDYIYGLNNDLRAQKIDAAYQSGFIHLKENRFDYAAVLFGNAADSASSAAEASYMAGGSYFLSGDEDKAGFYLRKALRGGALNGLTSRQRAIARQMLDDLRER